jgi:quercetin dioxygenase-like cupin family protein
MTSKTVSRIVIAAATAAALIALAQAPGVKRTLLQRIDVPDSNRETVMGIAEIPAGGVAGRHTHPGVEVTYVLEGSASLEIEGEMPRLVKAGESFSIPAGKVHDAKVVGDVPLKVLAIYVVEKGKPLASPAP